MSINKVCITGNLTRDPELRETASGFQVLNFGVAVNDRHKNQQTQQWEDYANFVDCTMFGNRAASVSRFLGKGSKVAIEGKLRWSQWQAQDGSKQYQGKLLGLENGVLSIEEENGTIVKFEQKDIASVRLAVIF